MRIGILNQSMFLQSTQMVCIAQHSLCMQFFCGNYCIQHIGDCTTPCHGIVCVSKCVKQDCLNEQPALLASDPNSVSADTTGKLLQNQYLPPLPGVDHMAHGFNIFTGEEVIAPLFDYTYCAGIDKADVLQNAYRGVWYQIPYQVADFDCMYLEGVGGGRVGMRAL